MSADRRGSERKKPKETKTSIGTSASIGRITILTILNFQFFHLVPAVLYCQYLLEMQSFLSLLTTNTANLPGN